MKFDQIWNELKYKWSTMEYLVINVKTNKAMITNLYGLVEVASKLSPNSTYEESLDPEVIEHEIKNELETMGIYVQVLKLADQIDYEDIKIVKSLNQFLGE